MLVLGIQKDYHSSVCLYEDNRLIYYCEEERLSRVKKNAHMPILCLNQIIKNHCKKVDVAVVAGYDSDSLNCIGSYLKHLKLIDHVEQNITFFKSHHLLHAAKAFYDSGFENGFVFVIDGRGSSFNLNNGKVAYETSSVYLFKNSNNFKCLYKKCFTNSKIENNLKLNLYHEHGFFFKSVPISIDENTIVEIVNENDLGHFYSIAATHFNFHQEEGKLMGLSAFGKENREINKILNSDDFLFKEYEHRDNLQLLNIKKYPELIYKQENSKNLTDLSFLIQQKFEKKYFDFITKHFNFNISKNLIITGGTGYNVVNNYKIHEKLKHVNLFIEPMCGDEGNSIAACQLYLKQVKPNIQLEKLNHLFIGNKYDYNNLVQFEGFIFKETNLDEIINLIIDKQIVALYQGRSEGGPRALGNRSLLLDPRIDDAKKIMNTVKKRESFRPFACSILQEDVSEWFDMKNLKESPFMMYAVQALEKSKLEIKSLVHVDNTCRIQTVTGKDNNVLYNLLKKFKKITNVPILMHTSFNLAGDPLVETPEDALNTLKKSELKYLYLPDINQLVIKK
jgi:carbamoyltransferase